MFIKQKKSGKIKGYCCADGRKQRDTIDRIDVSSPTVAMESIFISSVIDAKEYRNVATVDIPGAFMQADINDLVHL
jgi:Reverse transcriptase (RNA-dependent DNA polymerase)